MGSETGAYSYVIQKFDGGNGPGRLDVPSFSLQSSQSLPLSPDSEVMPSLSTSPPNKDPHIPASMLDNSHGGVKRSVFIFNRVVKKRSSCPSFPVPYPDIPSQ